MTVLKLYLESLDSKVNDIYFRVSTLQDLGDVFAEISGFALPGVVILDYSKLILDFVGYLEEKTRLEKR